MQNVPLVVMELVQENSYAPTHDQVNYSSDVTRFCDETRYISSLLIFIFHRTLKLSYLADGHLMSPVCYKLPSALVCTGAMLPENKEVTLGTVHCALWLHTGIGHPNGSEAEQRWKLIDQMQVSLNAS